MGATGKTNAMRILDRQKMDYTVLSYNNRDGKIDGESVAQKINKPVESVYKTLVAHSGQNLFVFVIPVHAELDLKKAAKVAQEKKVEMLPVKELLKWTGYIRGGCSPIGMKKLYPTFIDSHVLRLESVVISAGKIGLQIEINPQYLVEIIHAEIQDLIN